MTPDDELIKRKLEHLKLCASDAVAFNKITTGFERYSFLHYALTEVDISTIDLSFNFFGKKIDLPFYISCMTGGTDETVNINLKLARAAKELNVPLGLGSQRYALDSDKFNSHFDLIREESGAVPLIGNIGGAQVVEKDIINKLERLIKISHISALTIHLNPAQELFQKGGEINFKGLLTAIASLKKELKIPLIVKEVGSGIDEKVADELLWSGVEMIDVAGAGGTTWSGVEILRNGGNNQHDF
jgi:isopentenyl-diphosphate delta-isomerase